MELVCGHFDLDLPVNFLQETPLIPNAVATEQQSLVLVKKLLAIAVSNITYLRGLFPEAAYGNKYVGGKLYDDQQETTNCEPNYICVLL